MFKRARARQELTLKDQKKAKICARSGENYRQPTTLMCREKGEKEECFKYAIHASKRMTKWA